MTKLFLSLKFDDEFSKMVAEKVRNELRHYGIECVIAGDLTKIPPPEVVRSSILASDALLAIITSSQSDWIQNEIGIAYACDMPVYGLVREGVEVGGLLPKITSYVNFTQTFWELDIRERAVAIASQIRGSGGILAVVEPTNMLTGSTGKLIIAIRPRKLSSGDEIVTVYVPPGFRIPIYEDPTDISMIGPGISTEIPESMCRITASATKKNDTYPGFVKIEFLLMFPEIKSYLRAGWAEFKVRYTAPVVAGKYRFYGTDEVSIGGKNSQQNKQDASSFDFSPIIVKGEVSPVSLSGIIFTAEQTPLRRPGIVRAKMTMRLDPDTGSQRPDFPTVDAVCYLSASDEGKYEISGLAPGVYEIWASAIGYSESPIVSGLEIQAHKQPTSLDGYVQLK